jgi:glutathione S-transferase
MFYIVGTLHPYIARHIPRWDSRNMRGEVGASDAAAKDKAQKAAVAAVGETLEVFRKFYLDAKTFIGDHPSIADIRPRLIFPYALTQRPS